MLPCCLIIVDVDGCCLRGAGKGRKDERKIGMEDIGDR